MKNNERIEQTNGKVQSAREKEQIGWKLPLPEIGPWFVRFGLLGAIAFFVAVAYSALSFEGSEWIEGETTDTSLTEVDPQAWVDRLEKSNYVLPLMLAQQNDAQSGMSEQGMSDPQIYAQTYQKIVPSSLYLPGGSNVFNRSPAGEVIPERFRQQLDALISKWQSGMTEGDGTANRYRIEYGVKHNQSGSWPIRNSSSMPEDFWMFESLTAKRELMEHYAFYAVVEFDASGAMQIPVWYGLGTQWRDRLLVNHTQQIALSAGLENMQPATADASEWKPYMARIRNPQAFTIVYTLPRSTYSAEATLEAYKPAAMHAAGFPYLVLLAIGSAILVGIPPLRSLRRRPSNTGAETGSRRIPYARRLPLEYWLLGAGLPLFFYTPFAVWSYDHGNSPLLEIMAIWIVLLTFWCGLAEFVTRAWLEGGSRVLRTGSLTVALWEWLHRFDLADASDRSLLKIASAHAVLLAGIVTLAAYVPYAAGIALAVYLILLFYGIKKRKDQLLAAYARLYASVQGMARGELDVRIDGSLGVFEPMTAELQRVRESFKHAVEEEIKSQKLKSELVTNVSHDLKTPLTAIVTYVNLLQQNHLTEEQRRSYIDVLGGKSQRLTRLIEDLFEYTRASSGAASVAPVSVDLVELLKQARVELEDRLAELGVQLRFAVPEGKVILPLDSEKTFRIFENLYLNIANYAMPGSRAYVELTDTPAEVRIVFKNVSASELDFKPDEIMERFVRGDRARSAEGSGLGLAIVKSLVELQGGTFGLELDGDLFKALIRWPKSGAEGGAVGAG